MANHGIGITRGLRQGGHIEGKALERFVIDVVIRRFHAVPGSLKRQNRNGCQRRFDIGQDNFPKYIEIPGSIQSGGFDHLIRQVVNKLLDEIQSHRHGQHRNDMRPDTVHHAQAMHNDVSGNGNRGGNKHQCRLIDSEQEILQSIILLRHTIRGHGCDHQGEEHNRQRCQNAVEQIPAHGNRLVGGSRHQVLEILKRGTQRIEFGRIIEQLVQRLKRVKEDEHDGKPHQNRNRNQIQEEFNLGSVEVLRIDTDDL